MYRLNRRVFLGSGLALAGGAAWGGSYADAHLKLRPSRTLNTLPLDYNGFSVETAQLADPSYYDEGNTSCVALHRRLSPRGVLRLGGNTSEFCWWKTSADAQPPQIKSLGQGRDDNFMPQRFTAIAPRAVDNLRGFLDASGWTCIYGLNFGTGSPERDAEEAAYVAKALGPKLLYFQIGNEPDFYKDPNNLLRPPGWDFPDYLNEWVAIADAVVRRVPNAKFGGPDVGSSADWVVRFAREAPRRLGSRLLGLSGHYYAEGPPNSPDANIANLLRADPRVAQRMNEIIPAAKAAGLAFRMTEGNSCFRGGKPDMSNALASALWGGDYMLDMAARSCKGIDFHGGTGRQIAASVGDKLPGARNEADMAVARLGTFYSPFAGNRTEGFDARPLFYGMMLVEQFAGTTLFANAFEAQGVNATAYTARAANRYRIALFNKDAGRDLRVRIDLSGLHARRVKVWRLNGPALDATKHITLAGAEISHGTAAWAPKKTETIRAKDAAIVVRLPRASAILLFVDV
jgi:hypothetical protein